MIIKPYIVLPKTRLSCSIRAVLMSKIVLGSGWIRMDIAITLERLNITFDIDQTLVYINTW